MKNKILLLLLLVLVFASCSQENAALPQGGDNAKEVTVRVKMKLNDMVTGLPVTIENGTSTSTRSVTALSTDIENKINDVWVLQYSPGGTLRKAQNLPLNTNFNDFLLSVLAEKANIYFVANVGANATGFSATTPSSYTAFLALSKSYTTEAELLTGMPAAAGIPMVGELLNQDLTSTSLSIFSVPLKRLLSRVDITYSVAPGITLSSLNVCNVPATMAYYPTGTVYPAALPANFKSLPTESITASATPVTKTFYLPINMQGKNDNTDITNKTGAGFPYATYFELLGGSASVSRSYRSYVGSGAGDYNIEADKYYKINATIKGTSLTDKRVTIPESNCYIVAPGSSINIPISRARNPQLPAAVISASATPLTDCTASIYWNTDASVTSNSSSITNTTVRIEDSGSCAKGYFTVTGVSPGNAVVCIKDKSTPKAKILWSWHIWVTSADFSVNTNTTPAKASIPSYVWMDRNLGAFAVAGTEGATFKTTAGLLYQWGRKDPFLPSTVQQDMIATTPATAVMSIAGTGNIETSYNGIGALITGATYDTYLKTVGTTPIGANQLLLSINSPMLFLTAWAGSTATTAAGVTAAGGMDSWGGASQGQAKSIYDPCPPGWRVPSGFKISASWISPWGCLNTPTESSIITAGNTDNPKFINTAAITNGAYCDFGIYGKYPASGYRKDTGALEGVGSFEFIWTGTPSGGGGYCPYFGKTYVSINGANNRPNGFSVRCVQE